MTNLFNNTFVLLLEKHTIDILKNYHSAEEYALNNFDIEDDSLTDEQEERIQTYVDHYNSINSKYIRIYRAIRLDDISQLDVNNIGLFWSFFKHGAQPQNGKGKNTYVLTGIINTKNIDWETGFMSFFYYGEDQFECAVNTNVPIKIVEIDNKPIKPFITKTNRSSYSVWDLD